MGETFKNELRYREAIKNFATAYSFHVKEKARPHLVLYALIQLADTYSLVGDNGNFFKTTKELSGMFQSYELNRSRQESQAFVIIGNHYARSQNYDSAIHYYQRALVSSIKTFNPKSIKDNPTEAMIGFEFYVSGILPKKAAMMKEKFRRTGDRSYWHNAFECLTLAEKLLSQERNTLDMQDAKWEFLDANYNLYEDIISLLFEDKGFIPKDSLYATLFHYFEQSKSRSLKDALSEVERSTQIKNEDTLLMTHSDLKRKLLGVQDKLSAALERNDDAALITSLRGEIVSVDRAIEACKQQIEKQYPGYFNIRYGYQFSSLDELKKIIGKEKILLEYFWGSQSVYAIAIGNDMMLFEMLGRTDSISTVVDSTLTHFNKSSSVTDVAAYNGFASQAYTLYKLLVSPFESLLVTKKRIQIIPDGPISQVPFEVILTEKANSTTVNYRSLKYLVRSFSIGYAYSASVLFNKSVKAAWNPSLLAVSFTPSAGRRPAGVAMDAIAGAEEEMKMLSARFEEGEFLTGAEATETNFKTVAPGFDILHLAIHGRGNVEKDFSASLYFESGDNTNDDGILHAYELYGLKLNAAMAVLTACESGLGRGYRGEGMMSMANAFSYSGCQNILMSLWKVHDQASEGLMSSFYENLLNGNSIDDALRETKLRYLESSDELTADPKVWAPMVAYGSLNEVFHSKKTATVYSIIAIAVVLLLVSTVAFFRKKAGQKA